ncbi:hypothetical protein [Halobacteriovorax sp. JY17]|uniref:hypothetical protein n=1 Tax=Halobacteriovorax sp. JY17 TaxID=2014617 RepID=UPI000C467D25|nr:hypothetical protein [Halobacteriovorax sp. JY17]PIK14368.1 MAG: hypothetical protein CES88_08455 [Halobacteriovorax sp. JY17]
MNEFINKYDWQMTSQIFLIIGIVVSIVFHKRFKKYDEALVSLPFCFCLGISIFNSDNLIAFIFFSEIIFNLSNILFRNRFKQYDNKFFENVRYVFWVILLFCYYYSFNTFTFNAVPKNTGLELTFIVVLLLSIVFIKIIYFFLRSDHIKESINEVVGYEIFTVFVFSLKSIHISSGLMDSILPRHHGVIDVLILLYIVLGSVLCIKFYKSESIEKLKSMIRGLVIISLFPLLVIGENVFWEDYIAFSVLLVTTLLFFDLVVSFAKSGRFKSLLVFVLLCLLSGVSPFGHLFKIFKSLVDNGSQELFFLGITISTLTLALISKKLFMLCLNEREA